MKKVSFRDSVTVFELPDDDYDRTPGRVERIRLSDLIFVRRMVQSLLLHGDVDEPEFVPPQRVSSLQSLSTAINELYIDPFRTN